MPRSTYVPHKTIALQPKTSARLKIALILFNLITMTGTGFGLGAVTFYILSGGS